MVSFYFLFMTGKSIWVPSRTPGVFPTCCRWYCIPWVLQELLLSRHGRGVRPQARLFYVVLSMMLLLDLITNWHVFEQVCVMLVLKLYCFRYCSWTWYCNNYIWTPMYVEVLVNLCNMWLVCWIMYNLVCVLDYSRSCVILDSLPGLYGLKYNSAIASVVAIVLVLF